jgi:hypothetical protein
MITESGEDVTHRAPEWRLASTMLGTPLFAHSSQDFPIRAFKLDHKSLCYQWHPRHNM